MKLGEADLEGPSENSLQAEKEEDEQDSLEAATHHEAANWTERRFSWLVFWPTVMKRIGFKFMATIFKHSSTRVLHIYDLKIIFTLS